MRKKVSIVLMLAIVLNIWLAISENAVMATAQTFFDVAEDHWAYGDIMKLADMGVINGFEDGEFRPNEHVTRAQAAKMMVVLFKLEDFDIGNAEQFAEFEPNYIYKFLGIEKGQNLDNVYVPWDSDILIEEWSRGDLTDIIPDLSNEWYAPYAKKMPPFMGEVQGTYHIFGPNCEEPRDDLVCALMKVCYAQNQIEPPVRDDNINYYELLGEMSTAIYGPLKC